MADASRDATTRQVSTAMGRLHVADHAGDEPALVLMHGFPDDSQPPSSARGCARRARHRDCRPGRPRRLRPGGHRLRPALDRYLSPDLAAHLASLFARADLHLVDGASHWPQWDAPKAVSGLIR